MLEETLRAEAQVMRDMLSTHDTDDFMRRLAARIEQTPTRSQRVKTAPPNATAAAPPSFDTQPQGSSRPAARKGVRRRRPLPFVTSDPADRPAAALDHVRRLCETLLCAEGAATLMEAFDRDYDATGACAFACFLFIFGREDSALYWWRYAAGADDALSAHVLATYYAATGPLSAARAWCAYARFLGYTAEKHLPAPLRLSAQQSSWATERAAPVTQHAAPVNDELVRYFVSRERLPEVLAQH
ncbi:hypothetical protein ACFWMT_23085 [Streptomyces sp. NPDC058368]|uniref:hypothetical protein n=1 Tax=Streptomyces sp. NPDC058368 TaxID=3346461 RepID=UPI00365D29EE